MAYPCYYRRLVQRHNARNPRIYGSVLSGKDVEGSDLALLVETTDEISILDIGAIRAELAELLGIWVTVLTPATFPKCWRTAAIRDTRRV